MADEEALLTEAVQDYWRQQCYPLEREQLDQVLEVWPDVGALRRDVRDLVAQGAGQDSGEGNDRRAGSGAGEQERQRDAVRSGLGSAQPGAARLRAEPGPAQQEGLERAQVLGQQDGRLARGAGGLGAQRNRCSHAWTHRYRLGALHARWNRRMLDRRQRHARVAARLRRVRPAQDRLAVLPAAATAARLHAAARGAAAAALKSQAGRFGFADMLERLHAALQETVAPACASASSPSTRSR